MIRRDEGDVINYDLIYRILSGVQECICSGSTVNSMLRYSKD